jgi:phosphate-selective porin
MYATLLLVLMLLQTPTGTTEETALPLTETTIAAPKPAVEKDKEPEAGWKNGFFLQSNDQSFLLRITGQIQADYRDFLGTDDVRDIDTFLIRRARLGIEATMFRYYEFRLLPDFANTRLLQTVTSTSIIGMSSRWKRASSSSPSVMSS